MDLLTRVTIPTANEIEAEFHLVPDGDGRPERLELLVLIVAQWV
jgi:hypothetical protein